MISIRSSVSKGWLHNKGGYVFDEKYYMNPLYRRDQDQAIKTFLAGQFPEYPHYNIEYSLAQPPYIQEDQILVGGIQPNLILGAALGAEYIFYPDKDSDIKGLPFENIDDPNTLPDPETLLEHPAIRSLDVQIIDIMEKHPDKKIVPPFFWDVSGRAVIHGIITTSLKLIGQNAIMMVMTDPDRLNAFHSWITEAYIVLVNHFSKLANIPIKEVHIGECSGAMLSDEQYMSCITPYISRLGQEFGNVRVHTCGHSDHVLKAIAQVQNLTMIDTGSGTSVAMMRDLLGSEVEISLEPAIDLMLPASSKDKIIAWLGQVIEENKGGPLRIQYHLESAYSLENCLALHEELDS